jgi:hypothetical protein
MSQLKVSFHDPLQQFFSGKRRHERRAVQLAVEVEAVDLRVEATTVDVSEGGTLLALDARAITGGPLDVGVVVAAVDRLLGNGFEVRFTSAGVRVKAAIVRLQPPDAYRQVLIGCRFERFLVGEEMDRLVPPLQGSRAPLRRAPRAGVLAHLLLYPEGVEAGPRWIGRVHALSESIVDARVRAPDECTTAEVAAAVAGRPLHGRMLLGGRPVWQGDLQVLSVDACAEGGSCMEFRVGGRGLCVPDLERVSPVQASA